MTLTTQRAALAALLALPAGCGSGRGSAPADAGPQTIFAAAAAQAADALQTYFYAGHGYWNACVPATCYAANYDWGADALTDALYLRWVQSQDAQIVPWLAALAGSATTWGACVVPFCQGWSDVPLWDSIAAARTHEVTQDPAELARAEIDFDAVAASTAFALGACPDIDYQQQPDGGPILLKTLESDSNLVKAALLLYEATQDASYLERAAAKYAAIRRYFLDPEVPLYTVFVFDDGRACTQVPRRFFASVNGNLIWAGLHLALDTGDSTYLDQAVATATAVTQHLGDATGLFVDLEGEDDLEEPLVEAMYELASSEGQAFARAWILANAQAAWSARTPDGLFGRFFNGPAPGGTVTQWQGSGGFALLFAAAALAPDQSVVPDPFWSTATSVSVDLSDPPFSISFTGRGIALVGTLGEVCCGPGHARVFVDGTETFDETGIWQNESPGSISPPSTSASLPDTILFAWRWPVSGPHTLTFEPGIENAKEGGSFLHLQGYSFVP
ncbi:MAG TPA: hypothetical protein VMB50_03395 [Myxococcales bacterium]|nr:hypothetical protein [Myxococcales bacterium]